MYEEELLSRLKMVYVPESMPWIKPTRRNAQRFLLASGDDVDVAETLFLESIHFNLNRKRRDKLPEFWFTSIEGTDELGIPIHINKLSIENVDKVMSAMTIEDFTDYFCDQIERVMTSGYALYPNSYPGSTEVWDLRQKDNVNLTVAIKAILFFSPIRDILIQKESERLLSSDTIGYSTQYIIFSQNAQRKRLNLEKNIRDSRF